MGLAHRFRCFPLSGRIGLVFAAAWNLMLASFAASGDWAWLWLPTSELAAAAGIVLLSRWRGVRTVTRVLAVAFGLGLPILLFAVRLGFVRWLHLYAGPRTGLWYGNPNPLAGSIVVAAVVAVLALEPRRWPSFVLLPLAILAAGSIQVRGAVVAGVMAAIGLWWTRFTGRVRWRAATLGVLAALVFGWGLAVAHLPGARGTILTEGVLHRFESPGVIAPTGSGGVFPRLHAQAAAVRFTLVRPIGGWGYGGFARAWLRLEDPGATHPIANAHNEPLDLLVTRGILGLLAWSLPLAFVLWETRRAVVFLAPLLVVLVWLNAIETAFFWSGAFYGTWAAFGWALFDSRRGPSAMGTDVMPGD